MRPSPSPDPSSGQDNSRSPYGLVISAALVFTLIGVAAFLCCTKRGWNMLDKCCKRLGAFDENEIREMEEEDKLDAQIKKIQELEEAGKNDRETHAAPAAGAGAGTGVAGSMEQPTETTLSSTAGGRSGMSADDTSAIIARAKQLDFAKGRSSGTASRKLLTNHKPAPPPMPPPDNATRVNMLEVTDSNRFSSKEFKDKDPISREHRVKKMSRNLTVPPAAPKR